MKITMTSNEIALINKYITTICDTFGVDIGNINLVEEFDKSIKEFPENRLMKISKDLDGNITMEYGEAAIRLPIELICKYAPMIKMGIGMLKTFGSQLSDDIMKMSEELDEIAQIHVEEKSPATDEKVEATNPETKSEETPKTTSKKNLWDETQEKINHIINDDDTPKE